MGEGGLGPEIRDGHRLFERERARHDFTVNGPERFVRERARVQPAQALQHGALAVRRVNFLAGLELDVADLEHMARALVQQLDDLVVKLVDRLAMLKNAHDLEITPRPRGKAGEKWLDLNGSLRNEFVLLW